MAPLPDRYYAYYAKQVGGEIGPIYRAWYRIQKGRGIGSFLAGLWRFAKPLLFSGLKSVGKEAASAGAAALADLGTRPVKEVLSSRIDEVGRNLKRKAEEKLKTMAAGGLRVVKRPRLTNIKLGGRRKKRHSVRRRSRGKVAQRDIFSS
jgi:hypothetical protein